MKRIITIPNGQRVTLGEYVKAWRLIKSLPPQEEVKGWQWWATDAGSILRDFSFGVHDRINLRGKVHSRWGKSRDASHYLAERMSLGLLVRECKWCGTRFNPVSLSQRFCDASCQRSYNGF